MLIIELEDIYAVGSFCNSFSHSRTLLQHESTTSDLVSRILSNTRRFVQLFCETVDELMPPPTKDISEYDEVIDVILHQRRQRNDQIEGGQEKFPDHLLRR